MPARYFMMADGERRGPYLLEELPEAGLRPASWVWCKGMPDWQQAKDIPEICRLFRERLQPQNSANHFPVKEKPAAVSQQTGSINRFAGQIGSDELPSLEEIEQRRDISVKPSNTLPLAIFSTIVFPPMGIFSIYFSIAAKRCWKKSENPDDPEGQKMKIAGREFTPADWRLLAHEYSRGAKMWGGIAFFIGLIFYSFIVHHFL